MLVLGIESSCDESAVSVVEYDKKPRIVFEAISSQIDLHAQYGGVVPELAAREHLKNLPILLDQAEKTLNGRKPDLVAVTQGPGLKGCLLMGYQFAKGFALARNIPLTGVNHIEAHLHALYLNNPEAPAYPFLALIVSGGHTELIYARDLGQYQVIARTKDDAAGEAFDKSANLLGIEYPGGAALARMADSLDASQRQSDFSLPKVMRESEDFSFSGLKTAISLLVKRNQSVLENPVVKAQLAYAIQESIVEALVHKTKAAAAQLEVKFVTATGGVACNRRLRERLAQELGMPVYFPEPAHCVDNASMVALVGALRFSRFKQTASEDSEVLARWPIENIQTP